MLEKTNEMADWLGRSIACACGETHTIPLQKVTIESGALAELAPYLQATGRTAVALLADRHTFAVAGQPLAQLLQTAGVKTTVVVLQGNEDGEVIADERAIVEALLAIPADAQAVLAVGSGTIHDIVRFVCHQTGRVFLSVPTAPSVDGFASVGAPLLVRGFKQTIPACAPEAIFADLDVLVQAPQAMIAAGFGDMLGKYTSLADWRLGRELLGEPYCELAVEMTELGLQLCVENTAEIAEATQLGVRRLTEGLVWSGISMLLVGHSRPASGGEHHLSHFWEMRYVQQRRRALLHGAKVGAACVMMADLYEQVRGLTQADAAASAAQCAPPSAADDRAAIGRAYGVLADSVIRENFPEGPAVADARVQALAERLAPRWGAVQRIAASVPAPAQLAAWLRQAGGPATPDALGVAPELVRESLEAALFVRSRFTILRLARLLGLTVKGRPRG